MDCLDTDDWSDHQHARSRQSAQLVGRGTPRFRNVAYNSRAEVRSGEYDRHGRLDPGGGDGRAGAARARDLLGGRGRRRGHPDRHSGARVRADRHGLSWRARRQPDPSGGDAGGGPRAHRPRHRHALPHRPLRRPRRAVPPDARRDAPRAPPRVRSRGRARPARARALQDVGGRAALRRQGGRRRWRSGKQKGRRRSVSRSWARTRSSSNRRRPGTTPRAECSRPGTPTRATTRTASCRYSASGPSASSTVAT